MTALGRRELLRMAAPAIALPMVAAATPTEAARQVSREEILEAFRFFDMMELQANDLNLRYQILIDLLFETNPDTLRAKLQQLIDSRKGRSVLVNVDTGHTAPYHPDMYDDQGRLKETGQDRTVQFRDNADDPVSHWDSTQLLPKPKLRTRIAAWLMGWRFG